MFDDTVDVRNSRVTPSYVTSRHKRSKLTTLNISCKVLIKTLLFKAPCTDLSIYLLMMFIKTVVKVCLVKVKLCVKVK